MNSLVPITAEAESALLELQYRKRLRVLIPDISDIPDRSRVAAVLFKAVGLPPSEFRQMNASQLLPFVEQAIEAMAPAAPKAATPAPVAKPIGRPRKDTPRATVNARMIDEMQRNPESANWSCRKWAERLKCVKRSVEKTAAWKMILKTRAANKDAQKSRSQKRYDD